MQKDSCERATIKATSVNGVVGEKGIASIWETHFECIYSSVDCSYHQHPSPPLDNIRVMVIVWRLRGNIIRTAPCWVVWLNVHSQQHTHVSSSYRSSRLGLSHWDSYAMRRGGCLEFITVTWWSGPGGFQALSERPTGFLQCFDTVGLVIWPVKIVPEMTYNVSSGTLSLYTTTLTISNSFKPEWRLLLLKVRLKFPWMILLLPKLKRNKAPGPDNVTAEAHQDWWLI